jgi:integrase
VTKRKDKRVKQYGKQWGFVVDVPTLDGTRKQVRKQGFASEDEANDALRKLLDAHDDGTAVDPSKLTIARYLTERWLSTLDGRNLSVGTLDSYRQIVRAHLVPHLGTVRLQALDTAAVETMLATLTREGASAKTARNIHGCLSKALSDAMRWRLVSRNAATGAELPKLAERPPRAWTPEQLARFLGHVKDDRLAPLWRFYAVTGVRRGEALGLRWRDVDLEAGTVTITNTRVKAIGGTVEKGTKSAAGNRTISLDPSTLAALKVWRAAQRAEFMALGIRPAHAYVFTGIAGGPLMPNKVTAAFKRVCQHLGLPEVGVHGLRHSAATFLVASGKNPKVVAQRLGHDVVTLMRTYAHVTPAHDRDAAEALADAIDGVGS